MYVWLETIGPACWNIEECCSLLLEGEHEQEIQIASDVCQSW